jgi:hypothetical protein
MLAAGLGICGALLNFAFLATRAPDTEMVEFIAVKPDVVVNRGDRLKAGDLMPVAIPKEHVGNLAEIAYLYKDIDSIVGGDPVCRTLDKETLVLRDDLRTPPPELDLDKGEVCYHIPVDSRFFVPALYNPGDWVSFKVPVVSVPRLAAPAPSTPDAPVPEAVAATPIGGQTETIGPFKLLALGNRLCSAEVMRASRTSPGPETVLTVRASKQVAGEAERAETLLHRLQATDCRQVAVVLHSRKGDKK